MPLANSDWFQNAGQWCQENPRWKRLRPFDPGRQHKKMVSHTYAKDYGSKPGTGNPFWAGRTDTKHGLVIDPRHNPWAEYRLSDWDVEVLHRYFPDYDGTSAFAHLPELEGLLLTKFSVRPADLPSLTWPNIIAILTSQNQPPDPHGGNGEPAARAKSADLSNTVNDEPGAMAWKDGKKIYQFKSRVLYDLWTVLISARGKRFTLQQLRDRVKRWNGDTSTNDATITSHVKLLRKFWRDKNREGLADKITTVGGAVGFDVPKY